MRPRRPIYRIGTHNWPSLSSARRLAGMSTTRETPMKTLRRTFGLAINAAGLALLLGAWLH